MSSRGSPSTESILSPQGGLRTQGRLRDRSDPLDVIEIAAPREACPGQRTGLAMTPISIVGLFWTSEDNVISSSAPLLGPARDLGQGFFMHLLNFHNTKTVSRPESFVYLQIESRFIEWNDRLNENSHV